MNIYTRINFYAFCFMFIFFIGVHQKLLSQDKNVVWVHGLGDATTSSNQSGWSVKYAPEGQKDRQMKSVIPNFLNTSTSGVNSYASFLDGLIPNGAIGVGHSMGGLALRHADVYQKKLKGIVTFASPLTGAAIINNDWAASRFFDNVIFNFSRGIAAQLNSSTLTLQIASASIGVLGGVGISWTTAPPWGQTRYDLDEASAYVNHIGKHSTNTPKIHVWGNEEDPVTWRMLEMSTFNGFAKTVSTYADIAHGLYYANLGIGTAAIFSANPGLMNYGFNAAYHWSAVHEFFKTGGRGDAEWRKEVLKSAYTKRVSYRYITFKRIQKCHTETQTRTDRSCRRWGWFGWLCRAFTWVVSWVTCFFESVAEWATGYYDEVVLMPSDGTVTEWSAKGQYRPDVWGNRQTQAWSQGATIIEARGVNHSEFRNHSEVDQIFRDRIWNPIEFKNQIFKVKQRN